MRRDRIVSKLRELGYKLRQDAWRVQLFRHPVTMHIVQVRKRDDIDDDWVRSTLRQTGCSKEDIEKFIGQANN
jgi:hypothetical protein